LCGAPRHAVATGSGTDPREATVEVRTREGEVLKSVAVLLDPGTGEVVPTALRGTRIQARDTRGVQIGPCAKSGGGRLAKLDGGD